MVALADDNDELRALLAGALRDDGYDVIEAADGRALLELARRHAPDAVITDFDMPELNGIEVLRALQHEPIGPVIIMTGSRVADIDAEAEALGAIAVLSKPFEVETISRLLRQTRRIDRPRDAPRHGARAR